jgi:hypothetical protein
MRLVGVHLADVHLVGGVCDYVAPYRESKWHLIDFATNERPPVS